MNELDQVRTALVELWGQLAPLWAISPMTGRVYGYLLSKAEPVTADEIMLGIGLSRGAVSMACRELADWGLVETRRAEGTRQLAYRPEDDLEKVVRNIVRARKRKEWDPMLERLREWSPRLAGDQSADGKAFRQRIEAIEGVVSLAESMAESFLKGGLLQRFGLKALVASAKRRGRSRR